MEGSLVNAPGGCGFFPLWILNRIPSYQNATVTAIRARMWWMEGSLVNAPRGGGFFPF